MEVLLLDLNIETWKSLDDSCASVTLLQQDRVLFLRDDDDDLEQRYDATPLSNDSLWIGVVVHLILS